MPSNANLTPTPSARNLGDIFDSTLSMSDHIPSVSKSCFSFIRDLRRIRNILITPLHTLSSHLPSPFSSITAAHRFWTFPNLNLIVFSSFSTLPLEQCLNHPNTATSILFSNLFIDSELNGRSKNKVLSLSLTKLFSLVNLLISIVFSLFTPTVLLAPLTSLPCNFQQFAHVSK